MNQIGTYTNGNYRVTICNDGTKIRNNNLDNLTPMFPECIDYKITNYCDCGCPMCHEMSTVEGKHGDIMNQNFIDTLQPYTELAIGGGNPLSHPDLIPFLTKLKDKKIIANITVNQKHFVLQQELIRYLIEKDLVKGIGVSVMSKDDECLKYILETPNCVIHVINGIVTKDIIDWLSNKNLRMLILGYKDFGRGKDYHNSNVDFNKKVLSCILPSIIKKFKVVSFDNLAINQLGVKNLLTAKGWNEFYMGDDGKYTMYIDGVKEMFASSSTSNVRYVLKDNIFDMFDTVRGIDK